jgi:NAD+ kinase
MYKKIGMFLKHSEPNEIVNKIYKFFLSKNLEIYSLDTESQQNIKFLKKTSLDNLDLIISFGGDGTILQLSNILGDFEIPIIGINQGKIGFLTSMPEEDSIKKLTEIILENKCQIQKRKKINCLFGNNSIHALNEIVIRISNIARLGHFQITNDNNHSFSFSADGLIISTATGSTGYNLAAGGPILSYYSNMKVITPICPYKTYVQPLVLPYEETLTISLTKDSASYGITIDGQHYFPFEDHHEKIVVKPSKQSLTILYHKDYNFFELLQNKLNFGGTLVK